jgi:hypothetical protein
VIRLAALAVSALLLAGCYNAPESQVSAGAGGGITVKKLFTVDGCTVYRFYDAGSRYFTNCSGSTQWTERQGKTDVPVGVQGGQQ